MSMTGAGGPSTINSVRRNLFQSQLTRRPTGSSVSGTSAASSASSSSTSAETLRLDGQGASHIQGQGHSRSRSGTSNTTGQTGPAASRPESPGGGGGGGGDIVIRDTNGEIYLQDPPTPPLDDMDEMNLDTEQENERERKRLAEAVRQHQIDQNSIPVQPEGEFYQDEEPGYLRRKKRHKIDPSIQTEILEAVRASLRAKVAALAEDNWMYEREDPPRLQ
ncbi:hypothetical protein V8F33_001772 [Rhypophila sp. PSN 637]